MRNRLLRARLEAAIETAILALDLIDGDADLEGGADDDADPSDFEAPLCGVSFGHGDRKGQWTETDRAPAFVGVQVSA